MCKLLKRTRELLEQQTGDDLIKIAMATGLPYAWLRSVRYTQVIPAVDRVEKLYEHLSGNKLEVK